MLIFRFWLDSLSFSNVIEIWVVGHLFARNMTSWKIEKGKHVLYILELRKQNSARFVLSIVFSICHDRFEKRTEGPIVKW